VQERYERLAALQDGISYLRNERMLGAEQEVLVEGPSKKDPARLTGRTRMNKLVHFPTDGAEPGSLRTVRIEKAHTHHLEGSLVEGRATDAPRSLSLPLVASTASACSGCA